MALRATLAVLFLWCLSLNGYVVGGWTLSREEDLELQKQLKLLNNPGVKTIRTKYGDTYNCVDFYQQPAFGHPALQNHSFHHPQLRPSYPKGMYKGSSSVFDPKSIWLNGKGCPVGTVPIRRTAKNDLIRAKLAAEIFQSKFNLQSPGNPGVHYAVVRTNAPDRIYYGGGMISSLYNPPVVGSQFSGCHVMIRNGIDSLEAGWIVHPSLYKDNRTRQFIYTNGGQSHCFNTYCPGFVVTSRDLPIDLVFNQTSIQPNSIYDWKFFIYLDRKTKNWFLLSGTDMKTVGYWPGNIFPNGLANSGTYMEWGGEVYSPPDTPSPKMGSGNSVLSKDRRQDAFSREITIINETRYAVEPPSTAVYADVSNYLVVDQGNVGGDFQRLAFWGGLGGYIGE